MKHQPTRAFGTLAAALLAAASLAACGSSDTAGSGSSSGGDLKNAKIAFLMPDIASTRYEQFDAPLFKAKVKELCPNCEVLYQNANADAAKQQQQANSAITQGVKAIVIDPVDSAAAASIVNAAKSKKIPVISYDRPIPAAKADYYVSFDNEKIGALIAQSLVDKVKKDGGTSILEINGSPTDAAAGLIKKGVHSVVDSSGLKLLAEFDTPDWAPPKAQSFAAGQISQFKDKINGVVAANDGTGGGAIAAFKAAGVNPVPPVSGNDAELAALQRIVNGDQYNTISKPIKIVAEAAATVAYGFAQGKPPSPKTTLFDTPAELFVPEVVTLENLNDVMVKGGRVKASELCTTAYKAACDKAGIK